MVLLLETSAGRLFSRNQSFIVLLDIVTSIEDKEKYWNDMVQKLFEEFNVRMEQNINQYLNMYVKNNNTVFEY